MGAFGRFTLAFVLVVLLGFGAFLYFTGRLPIKPSQVTSAPAPNSSMAPLPAAPAPASTPMPGAMEEPPDIAGLNYTEVAVPGAELPVPTPPSQALSSPGDYVADITSHHLSPPIENLQANQFTDTFNDTRGGSKHEATDIMEPRGTPVHAIDEGNIVKLFTSKKGGLTIYQFDNSQTYCYYYAHLDRYADGIKEGMLVRPGQVIGYVGSTGDANAAAPHLHFAISLLDPDKKYWKGTPLNPYPVLTKLTSAAR